MAIILNDNLKINAGKPIDRKYLSTGNTAYVSVGAVNAAISISERYTGLTVNILGTEYWYRSGVTNTDLIQKKYDSIIPAGNFVTGGTNVGYFSGYTGVQILPINHSTIPAYSGNYISLYNYYYRGTDGKIHIGTPNDGISKRGYVKTTGTPMSWIWNEYVGDGTLGWILIAGNIANQIGTFQTGIAYYPPSSAHTETGYTNGVAYASASYVDINTVVGSLTTGSTITIGGPVFDFMEHNNLHFRTIQSLTTDTIKITNDEVFVYLSGSTGNQLITASNGLTKSGQEVKLGGTLTGTTTITDARIGSAAVGIQYGADYSANFTNRSLIDKGYLNTISSLGGERIFKTICQSHSFIVNDVIGWSGGTYNKAIANGCYDGEVLGIVTKCNSASSFELTQAGYYSGFTACFIPNTTYFLSASIAGCLTSVEPSTPNYISKSVLIATSINSGWVLPYAAYVISSGITEGGPLIKSMCLPLSPYPMTSTDFFVGVAGGSVVVLPSTPKNGMVVVIADISGTALASPITVFGTIIGPQSSATINTDNGSLTFIWNGTTWSVIGFAPAAY